jgi:hypothetical protein
MQTLAAMDKIQLLIPLQLLVAVAVLPMVQLRQPVVLVVAVVTITMAQTRHKVIPVEQQVMELMVLAQVLPVAVGLMVPVAVEQELLAHPALVAQE